MSLRPTIDIRDSDEIKDLLTGLVLLNLGQLRRGLVPPLSAAPHVRYRREPRGREAWQSAMQTFERGFGDCEDLASWEAASLQLVGQKAFADIIEVRPGLKHCVVRLEDGSISDPSKRLGMGGKG